MAIRRETIWQAIEYAAMAAIIVCGFLLASGCVRSARRITDTTNADQSVAAIRELSAQVNAALQQNQAGRDVLTNDPGMIVALAALILLGPYLVGKSAWRIRAKIIETASNKRKR